MANNFSGPEVIDYFRFEPGTLTAGGKGVITLTNENNVGSETVDFREGTGCARFDAIDRCMSVADSALPAGCPLKSGVSNFTIGLAFWVKVLSWTSSPYIFVKGTSSPPSLYFASNQIWFGTQSSSRPANNQALTAGVWYHFTFSFDTVTGLFYSVLHRRDTNEYWTKYGKIRSDKVWVGNAGTWYIGAYPNPNYYLNGLLDEFVIFNKWLTFEDADAITLGRYPAALESKRSIAPYTGNSFCAALYQFESAYTFGFDSVGKNNLLKSMNGATGYSNAPERTDYKRGSGCVKFKGVKYLQRGDQSLSTDFPFRGNNANPQLSIACWFKTTSVASGDRTLLGKYNRATASDPEFYYYGWRIYLNAAALTFDMQYGAYNQSTETKTLFSNLQANRWYHLSFTYDRATKTYYAELWDDTAQTLAAVGPLTTTNTANYYQCDWFIGGAANSLGNWTGSLDQLAVFNDILNSAEMSTIRANTYNYQADAHCVALYDFEPGPNFLSDSKGGNRLYESGNPTCYPIIRMEGVGYLYTGIDSDYSNFRLNEEDMDAKFPWKSDGSHDEMSIAGWWMPTVMPTMDGYYRMIMGKGDFYASPYHMSWALRIQRINPNDTIRLVTGYNNGASLEYATLYSVSSLPLNRWYFFGLAINRTTKAWTFYLYDSVTGQAVATTSGVLTNTPSLVPYPFWIGNAVYQDSTDTYASHVANSNFDELSIWNKAKTLVEFGLMKDGAPPLSPPPSEVRQDRADISGNARHLADNGALQTGDVQGKIGNAAYFSGAGEQLLRLAQAPNLTGDQEFTVAFRMKPHLKSNPASDIYWHFKVGDLEIRAGFAPGQTRAFVSASTPSLSCRTGNVIPADTFSFIAIYFDTSGLYIDVNNSNEASQAGVHTGIVTPATAIEAGISAAIAMNISIDELGLWVGLNALSESQRTTLYSGNYGQRPSFS
jgi:hypothetical protein